MIMTGKQLDHIEKLERLKSELGELELEVRELQATIKRFEDDPIEQGTVNLAMHRKLLTHKLKTIRLYRNAISKATGHRPR